MCGIVGYIGKRSAQDIVLEGLQTLEYRGYDSAGMALLRPDGSGVLVRQVGRVEALGRALAEEKPGVSHCAIGHTRWATHGVPAIRNAHPQTNAEQTIFVVHNGIIENHAELRQGLEKAGYSFTSETDTEVIPHLVDYYYQKNKDIQRAFVRMLEDIRGAYAIAMVTTHAPKMLFVARVSSPLVIGVGQQEYVIASDPTALLAHTKEVIFLEDDEYAVLTESGHTLHHRRQKAHITRATEHLDFDVEQASLGAYPNFMRKEIFEAPQTIRSATLGRIRTESNTVKLGGIEGVMQQLSYIDRMVIVACGTSYYAGLVGEYFLEELAGIPVEVQFASEFKYRNEPFSRSTALLAISQSGETADTIAALKKVEGSGVLRLGVVNAVGSSIARMTDAGIYCHAGPEQAVASTKAFIAQVTVLLLLALRLSSGRQTAFEPLLKELDILPQKAEKVLAQADAIEEIARKYASYKDMLFIGRHLAFPCALEGALKVKEVSYIHAEGYAAGEMKHGPLAMIDEAFPTVALACNGLHLDKTYGNIQEIKARGGKVLAIATQGNRRIKQLADDVIYIPDTLPETQVILAAIVLQLLAYGMATHKGLDVDRPRNLAKSVTVE